MNQKAFLTFSKIVLVNVFLVILAGGVVRMTQSGMGCPDWPKCFGQWIPPTNESQLPANYKQIYAFKYVDLSFNAYHTWVEYINRLLGMILGLLLLVQFIWAARYYKTHRNLFLLCGATLILTGFQGYLGSKVVEANLEVVKITVHMLVALLIAALSIAIINKVSFKKEYVFNKKLKSVALTTMILLVFQIIMGTQVRQQIDEISKSLNFQHRDLWIKNLSPIFFIHRSFSIVIAILCLYLFNKYQQSKQFVFSNWMMLATVIGNILLGAVMTYLDVPAIAQPLHLLFSSILLMSVFYNWLNTKQSIITEMQVSK